MRILLQRCNRVKGFLAASHVCTVMGTAECGPLARRFGVPIVVTGIEPVNILHGVKEPQECPAFGTRCTPERLLGAPMASTEGACAAYYRYRTLRAVTVS